MRMPALGLPLSPRRAFVHPASGFFSLETLCLPELFGLPLPLPEPFRPPLYGKSLPLPKPFRPPLYGKLLPLLEPLRPPLYGKSLPLLEPLRPPLYGKSLLLPEPSPPPLCGLTLPPPERFRPPLCGVSLSLPESFRPLICGKLFSQMRLPGKPAYVVLFLLRRPSPVLLCGKPLHLQKPSRMQRLLTPRLPPDCCPVQACGEPFLLQELPPVLLCGMAPLPETDAPQPVSSVPSSPAPHCR